ncbi:MAG: 3-deoxy-8-phosphooctulonate synthase [Deltaproteobacteria bacterium]|nr:MAG: 3-deoxy-8-phosphooctulonate synthase [Deltaproteobacteria bacterium]
MYSIELDQCTIGEDRLFLIAGPCVIESAKATLAAARELKRVADRWQLPLIFKSSYDKANRTSYSSFRGPGLEEGLDILAAVRRECNLPVVSDVHSVAEVERAAEVLDLIQIPAFLCRQTDLIMAAAATGKPINVKKGQFLAPWDMTNVVAKIHVGGNRKVLLTERGSSFGYNNLVVDMRSLNLMKEYGLVVFDATHSVQLPGGSGDRSGGDRRFVETLARAAVAAGVDGIFMEVHQEPDLAPCDGPNSIALANVDHIVQVLLKIHAAVQPGINEQKETRV